MGELLVVTGPIAAGKSTVAAGVADRLAAAGRSVVVTDLDDVVDGLRSPDDDIPTLWARARRAHAALVVGRLASGVDWLVAHGPFLTVEEQEPLLRALPEAVTPRWALLLATFDVAVARVADEPSRVFSRDPVFLAATYDRFAEVRDEMPPCEWTVDTTAHTAAATADRIVGDLLR